MKGYTLALDFLFVQGCLNFWMNLIKLRRLRGRIYLSKDARMKKEIFWQTYPHAHEFRKYWKSMILKTVLFHGVTTTTLKP